MKRLTKSDREWFLNFLKTQIKEKEFLSWRYKTEETYGAVARLKRIYNILSYENPEASAHRVNPIKNENFPP